MQLIQLIDKINSLANNREYKTARTYIEINLAELERSHNYLKLNYEASQLYSIILSERKDGLNLSRLELHTINEINKASNNYDIPYLRMLLKTGEDILTKQEVLMLLSPTSKSVLTSMGYELTNKPLEDSNRGVIALKLLEGKQKERTNAPRQSGRKATTFHGMRAR